MHFTERPAVGKALRGSGLLRALEALPARPGLLVLNYHRVADGSQHGFDTGTVSASTADFAAQISYVRRHFETPGMPAVLRQIEARRFEKPTAVITFDDGYRDNFERAFPILRSLGVPATFFVVTDYIDAPTLPWWDRVAWLVNTTARGSFAIDYPWPARFDPGPAGRHDVIRRILRIIKDARPLDHARFFAHLEEACGRHAPDSLAADLFLRWPDAVEMHGAGMTIGSHTRSHRVLAALTRAEQLEELQASKARIGEMVGAAPEVLSYPVGGPTAFTSETRELARACGYRAAFSFFGGYNDAAGLDPYSVARLAVEKDYSFTTFRLRAALHARLPAK